MEDVSLAVAFGAGLLSFLSPCVLPMIPIYIANLAGAASLETQTSRWRPFLHSVGFVFGFSIVFIVLGASIGLIGRVIPAGVSRIISGSVLVVFGIFMLASRRISWLNYEVRVGRLPGSSMGYLRSIMLGAAFALAWTPCIGPILGGVLSLALNSQTVWRGVYLLGIYSLGLGIPFIVAGLFLSRATPVIRWLTRRGNVISLISGILLIFIGVLVLTNNLGILQFGL